ncbi:MAG: PrsW family intramembrane metalloprotease [Bacteroidales bacterium]|nr:PrsW family intramembrane metalloprotease [Bacteroidales bacterium]
MQTILVLIAALAPVAVLIYYIYRRDKYQKEPVKELLKAFGLGIMSVFASLLISTPLGSMGLYGNEPSTLWGALSTSFFGAAVPEEIAKYLMFWLLVRKNRFFDERMDGIVYASVVSLGFAAVENIMYLVSNYESWMAVGISRALFSVPAHFFFGVLMGYYYSLYRFCPSESKAYGWLILGAPIIVHGLFDTVLFSVNVLPSLSLILMVLFLILCNNLRKRASRSIAEHLERDVEVKI